CRDCNCRRRAGHSCCSQPVGIDVYLAGPKGSWERHPIFVRPGRTGFSALEAGDLDGDKAPDLVATDEKGNFELFLGDGKGGFADEASPEAQQPSGPCRGYGLRIIDIDHDGKSEIVASYAGEPDALFDPKRCPASGGVAAWTLNGAK
ncbi:MAG: VCBS repeat-containing protein, partial [Thermoanaerobaculia bacterium]